MFTLERSEAKRYILAAATGLVWAAAFPKMGVAGLAWLAPGLILATTLGLDRGAIFRTAYVAGLAHFLASLYWLLLMPVTFAPILAWLALAAYLAFYPALWASVCCRLFPAPSVGEPGSLLSSLSRLTSSRWRERLSWALFCAALWVTAEMIQARLVSGFPWNMLGVSQYRMLPLIQISSITGVYGVSFLMVWFSVALLCAGAMLPRSLAARRLWTAELIAPLLALAAVVTFGLRPFATATPAAAKLKLALIQPSIPQRMIWDPAEAHRRFQQIVQLSEKALQLGPDVLVWPEAAVPNVLRFDPTNLAAVTNLVRPHKVWLILGADDVRWRPEAARETDYDYYNSSFLVSPEGQLAAHYQKRKLVIFGEYVPFHRWLPFLGKLTGLGSFAPGRQPVTFEMPNLQVKTSVLICFEDAFPHLAREHAAEEIAFLLNLTNNGWFGESAAQWQHAANAVFRAVENGLPLVRCTNNGLTCWIDAQGGMHDVYFPGTKDIYGVGFKLVEVPLRHAEKTSFTFYRQHGDWFGWSCVGFSVCRLGTRRFLKRARALETTSHDLIVQG